MAILILVQSFAAVFFLSDTIADFWTEGFVTDPDDHMFLETVASLSLVVSVLFEVRYLMQMLRRQAHMSRGLSIATGALHDLMESFFRDWRLTPAEQDVAMFVIKGMSISDIAQLRGSAEGTVKAHLNAIYRKADVSGRGELVSLLIEDLMAQPLVVPAGDGQSPA
ncbi:helix-turn-helix transcriptional regulator [Thalassovita taeanensis]|uniref:DNA-binding transcriptional regulator, CsgD family n=1 Tax=Thalassovita taeanensis TaxID=657014 RepID=A0A1H8ZL84_9RHOB|nr:helix-turn-helix transcriptional regulator [Thalassovita taeanensis]SEP64488.1 DNA-binding transcriptional regulator, CsgD family [Thalassovita taeanensis]